MATSTEINAIADIILAEFESNPAKFSAALSVSNKQGALAAAKAALARLQADWELAQAAHYDEVNAAVVAIGAAEAARDAFVDTDPDLTDAGQLATWNGLILDVQQAERALSVLQAGFAAQQDAHDDAVNLAVEAVTAAQEALASLFEG